MVAPVVAVGVIELVDDGLKVVDKLLAKVPNYPERHREEIRQLKANLSVYKDLPPEKQVNTYVHNLLKEVNSHRDALLEALP